MITNVVRGVLNRLIARLDHRWKRPDGTLPETANTYAWLNAVAGPLAEMWAVLHDIALSNDIDKCYGRILDLEAQDRGLARKPGWDDETLRWWIRLHDLLYVSNGTPPELKFLSSYFLRRNLEDAKYLYFYNNECPICGYKEPAFYTLEFPWQWLWSDPAWFKWDPSDEGQPTAGFGWDQAVWGDEPEEKVLNYLRFLVRATAAGVRINAVIYGGLMFDPDDSDELHPSTWHGWAADDARGDVEAGVWNGATGDMLVDYGLPEEEIAQFHVCVPTYGLHWDATATYTERPPEPLVFDPVDDDELRWDWRQTWDVGYWE